MRDISGLENDERLLTEMEQIQDQLEELREENGQLKQELGEVRQNELRLRENLNLAGAEAERKRQNTISEYRNKIRKLEELQQRQQAIVNRTFLPIIVYAFTATCLTAIRNTRLLKDAGNVLLTIGDLEIWCVHMFHENSRVLWEAKAYIPYPVLHFLIPALLVVVNFMIYVSGGSSILELGLLAADVYRKKLRDPEILTVALMSFAAIVWLGDNLLAFLPGNLVCIWIGTQAGYFGFRQIQKRKKGDPYGRR